jgi:hypothetical protein
MNWEEYANTVTSLFNKLKEKGWSTYGGQNSDAMKLLNLYFTSGAYAQTKGEKSNESI